MGDGETDGVENMVVTEVTWCMVVRVAVAGAGAGGTRRRGEADGGFDGVGGFRCVAAFRRRFAGAAAAAAGTAAAALFLFGGMLRAARRRERVVGLASASEGRVRARPGQAGQRGAAERRRAAGTREGKPACSAARVWRLEDGLKG